MSIRSLNSQRMRFLMPGVAVLIVYMAFFALPQSAETARIADEVRRITQENKQLSGRLKSQVPHATRRDDVAAQFDTSATILTSPDAAGNRQSRVQVFARVHSVLVSHGIEHISAKPDDSVGASEGSDSTIHRVSFSGGFQTVLTALESINDSISQASVVVLTMNRAANSGMSQWEIGFRFREEIR